MNSTSLNLFWSFGPFVIVLFIVGLYCMLVTYNLIRVLVGVEVLMKAATLLTIVTGYVSGRTALTQAIIITLIVLEVVVVTVAAGIVIAIWRHKGSLDVRDIRHSNDEGMSNE